MKKILSALILMALAAANAAAAQTAPLFVIERSKNANVVKYDARLNDDGSFDRERPVEAYWLLKAKDGSRKELTALDRKAYGFEASPSGDGTVKLKITAFDKRDIKVFLKNGKPAAEIAVNGKPAILEKIFITSVERFPLPKVTAIELFGRSETDGGKVYEKITP